MTTHLSSWFVAKGLGPDVVEYQDESKRKFKRKVVYTKLRDIMIILLIPSFAEL